MCYKEHSLKVHVPCLMKMRSLASLEQRLSDALHSLQVHVPCLCVLSPRHDPLLHEVLVETVAQRAHGGVAYSGVGNKFNSGIFEIPDQILLHYKNKR